MCPTTKIVPFPTFTLSLLVIWTIDRKRDKEKCGEMHHNPRTNHFINMRWIELLIDKACMSGLNVYSMTKLTNNMRCWLVKLF